MRYGKPAIVFLYPGQGAQHVGMGLDLCKAFPAAYRHFDEADDFLPFSLSDLCFNGPEKQLNDDVNAQLAVYTISCITTDIFYKNGLLPDVTSGYSSGFYAAAYAAGCFDFITGLSLVQQAGEILIEQGKSIDGGMGVIFGLSIEQVEEMCHKVKNVDIAILNTTTQIVVSGLNQAVKRVMAMAAREGALDTYSLPAATAYHSSFMEKSCTRFTEIICPDGIHNPLIPIYSYSTLKTIKDARSLFEIMAEQLKRPVLWVDLIQKLRDKNINTFFEIGPGALITRSVRWIDRRISVRNTSSTTRINRILEERLNWTATIE